MSKPTTGPFEKTPGWLDWYAGRLGSTVIVVAQPRTSYSVWLVRTV